LKKRVTTRHGACHAKSALRKSTSRERNTSRAFCANTIAHRIFGFHVFPSPAKNFLTFLKMAGFVIFFLVNSKKKKSTT